MNVAIGAALLSHRVFLAVCLLCFLCAVNCDFSQVNKDVLFCSASAVATRLLPTVGIASVCPSIVSTLSFESTDL